MSGAADKHDISAVADLLADKIAAALTAGSSYTYEDARRMNSEQGWTYEVKRRQASNVQHVKSMRLTDEELSLAWLTANRRVDNGT